MRDNADAPALTTSLAADATDAVSGEVAVPATPTSTPTPTHLSSDWERALDESFQPIFSAWSQPGTQVPNPTDLTRFDSIARMADSEDCWDAVRDRLATLPVSELKDLTGALVRHWPASLSPSLYLATHPDPEVRDRMAEVAETLGISRSAPLLLAVMGQAEDPSVRGSWYSMLALTTELASSRSDVSSCADMAKAIAFQIKWQERHPGRGMPTGTILACITAISKQPRALPRESETSITLARWLADTVCQRLSYLDYAPASLHWPAMTRSERKAKMDDAAYMAALTLASGNVRTKETLSEAATHISERKWHHESDVPLNRSRTLAVGAMCLTEAGIPADGCVDLDIAERFARQCAHGDDRLREVLAMSLMSHLLRRPEDRPRALGLIGDVVAVPPGKLYGNITRQLLCALPRGLGVDGFLDRPDVRRVYEAAATIWADVAAGVIEWADPAVLKRLADTWRRKKEFPAVLEALVKRGVPVFTNNQALRMVQSSSIDRTQAILATSLTIDKKERPRKPASKTPARHA